MIQVLEKLQANNIGFTIKGGKDIEVNVDDYDSINLAVVALAKKAKEKFPESEFANYYDQTLKHWERS